MFLRLREERQRDQHDSDRINRVQHRRGQTDNTRQTDIRNNHAGRSKKRRNGRIRNTRQQLMEILTDAGNQADTGIEACNDENCGKQHLPDRAKQTAGNIAQRIRASRAARPCRAGQCANVRQHRVNQKQHCACNPACTDGAAAHLLFILDTVIPNIQRDNRAEIECRQRIHCLVAIQNARQARQRSVVCGRHAVMLCHRMKQAAEKQHENQYDQRRT